MGDRCGMSISADSPSDETLNRGPLALLLRRQYEFPFGINIVQFSIFFNFHRKRNTETDIKWSLPYGTAPGIECFRASKDLLKPPCKLLYHSMADTVQYLLGRLRVYLSGFYSHSLSDQ